MEDTPRIISKKELHKGNYLSFQEYTFENRGKIGHWEAINRVRADISNPVFGIKAIPIIFQSKRLNFTEPHVIIISSYRVPVGNFILEFPAGLMDPKESVETCVMREVHEETGYYTKRIITEFNPTNVITYTDPWKSNDNEVLHVVEIDADEERNLNPKQNLDDSECIEIIIVSLKNLKQEIEALVEKRKCLVDNQLLGFALGMSLPLI